MKDKTGGAAFPMAEPRFNHDIVQGMTLLDYFAGKALHEINVGGGWSDYENLAKQAYSVASAMIKEREKWV